MIIRSRETLSLDEFFGELFVVVVGSLVAAAFVVSAHKHFTASQSAFESNELFHIFIKTVINIIFIFF